MSEIAPAKPIPPGFLLGSEIDISDWDEGHIVEDIEGRIQCFMGFSEPKMSRELPWYSVSVAQRRPAWQDLRRFVKLRDGVLYFDGFLQPDRYYRVIDDRALTLPVGTRSYFGVTDTVTRSEDAELTRTLFGGTRQELESVTVALAYTISQSYSGGRRSPRVTFSRVNHNHCDLTRCLIPQNFPYAAFENAQFDWGHVSLYGLRRLISFFSPTPRSAFAEMLLAQGGTTELLKRMMETPRGFPIYGEEVWP